MSSKTYFKSSGYVDNPIINTVLDTQLNISTLPAFLRTLLVMDGTVTKALSAWFWEPINVVSIKNSQDSCTDLIDDLDCKLGDSMLFREVELKGKHSQASYAYARSVVSLSHLPNEIADSLQAGKIGIGELLREEGIETYREIIDINYFKSNTDTLLINVEGDTLSRSYRILVNGAAAIMVTEFFPVNMYSTH